VVVGMGRGEGCWIPFRSRANREHLERCEGLLPGAHGQNLALTVLYLPCVLESSVVVGGTNAAWTEVSRCRANMAHIRQSGPDSGLGFQVKVLTLVSVVHFGGGGGRQRCVDRDASASERRGNTLKGLKAVYIYIYIKFKPPFAIFWGVVCAYGTANQRLHDQIPCGWCQSTPGQHVGSSEHGGVFRGAK